MWRALQFLLLGQNQQAFPHQGSEPRTKAKTVNKQVVLSIWIRTLLISAGMWGKRTGITKSKYSCIYYVKNLREFMARKLGYMNVIYDNIYRIKK